MFTGRPLAVVQPKNTDEVANLMRLCSNEGVKVVPAGGLTGLAGGATPDSSGEQLVLSLSKLNRVRAIDEVGGTITVEAGCVLAEVQLAAADKNLILPISLASEGSLQIGGAIATNAGGSNVLRYGMTRNRVLGLEVVLADGTILNGLRALRKDNAGFDWKHWFVGSEGALGIVTAAVLQLAPATPYSATVLAGYTDLSSAVDSLTRIRAFVGDSLTAFELMERRAINRSADLLKIARPLPEQPWLVLLEARSSLAAIEKVLPEACIFEIENGRIADAILATSEAQRKELWRLRESISQAEALLGRSLKHDISVPVSSIASFVDTVEKLVRTKWPQVCLNLFGHAGDGNLHVNVLFSSESDVVGLSEAIHDCVAKYDGSISAEHGIGQYRVEELYRLRPTIEIEMMKKMKNMLDPNYIMNPGKVLKIS